ncbi:phosphotransferase [Hahella ganghwensis]|uniref:phosphotransferase n=1 Tax=Hahella ganghwensis TaxID=286420 RepID=UPI0003A519A5|nr:phosphotransferase [Hahella ganghwensis]
MTDKDSLPISMHRQPREIEKEATRGKQETRGKNEAQEKAESFPVFQGDSRLDQVADYLGESVQWRLLHSQGDANPVLWGSCRNGSLVLRLNADAESAFGANRKMEQIVLQAIMGYAWSPNILRYELEEGWCLMEHHGLSLDQFCDHESTENVMQYRQQLLAAVNDMQQIQDIPEFDYASLFRYYRQRFQNQQDHRHVMQLEELIDDSYSLPQEPLCLVHHDLHQGNFCLDQGQLVILDWEYAGRGNPWLDMAALVQFHQMPIEDVGSLFVCRKYSMASIKHNLALATKVNVSLEALWIAARKK